MNIDLNNNLSYLTQALQQAITRSRHGQQKVQLVAASKKIDPSQLLEAWAAGVKIFGENRVQELRAKAPLLPRAVEWHFIGGLQTNKVRDVVQLATLIHSVDRLELAQEIDRRAAQIGKHQKVLMEVNVAGEASKHGVHLQDAEPLLRQINERPHLEIIGLMTVAPFYEELEKVRPFFATLRTLRDDLQQNTGIQLPELSMGMSHDFTIAVEEGATMVRIGTALFGPRTTNKTKSDK